MRNIGVETARAVGFVASARNVTTFSEALMPSGERVFGAAPEMQYPIA